MNISVPHSTPKCGLHATKQAARGSGASQKNPSSAQITHQLSIWESQQKPENEYPLRIEQLPLALQWWEKEHFWLIHVESGLRVPGTWTLAEAKKLRDLSQQWDWRLDKDRRVACGLQLLALTEAICKRSAQNKGGEA